MSDPLLKPLASLPDQKRLAVFFTWGLAALGLFPVMYGLTNHWASLAPDHHELWISWETRAPFIKEWIWVYLSLNIVIFLPLFMLNADSLKRYCQANLVTLFIGTLIFTLFPAKLGFDRIVPEDPLYQSIFIKMIGIDHPHNLVPSLHVTFSTLAIYSVVSFHHERPWLRRWFLIWNVAICVSVILIRQHHMIDVITGLALAWVGLDWIYFRSVFSNPFKIQRSPTNK